MRTLILYTITDMAAMLEKGNVWYLRHYEAYFDRVCVLYLIGRRHKPVVKGRTELHSLGTGRGKFDLFFAPLRIYRFACKCKGARYLTADPLLLWWNFALLKLIRGEKIIFMPVCIPEQIYASCGKTLSGLPVWIDRLLIKLSFLAADQVITGKSISVYIEWLSGLSYVKPKVKVVDMIVEELPTIKFFESLSDPVPPRDCGLKTILYVGRLHAQKLVGDIIRMLGVLHGRGEDARLVLVGDGGQRSELENLAEDLGIRENVIFAGAKPNCKLSGYYKRADVFVSPLTGTSLREAALCRIPIVAYNIDWVRGFLVHEKNALLVEKGDIRGLADEVSRLLRDRGFAAKLSSSLYAYALKTWGREHLAEALAQTFD